MDFGLGYSEIGVILIIALIVVGPRRLPELMRTFGKLMGQLRRMSDELRREVLYSDEVRSLRDTMNTAINPTASTPASKSGPPPVPPRLKLKTPAEADAAAAPATADSAAPTDAPAAPEAPHE